MIGRGCVVLIGGLLLFHSPTFLLHLSHYNFMDTSKIYKSINIAIYLNGNMVIWPYLAHMAIWCWICNIWVYIKIKLDLPVRSKRKISLILYFSLLWNSFVDKKAWKQTTFIFVGAPFEVYTHTWTMSDFKKAFCCILGHHFTD